MENDATDKEAIPRVDLGPIAASVPDHAITQEALLTVGRQLMAAFTDIGFCYMEHHGLSRDEMEAILDFARRFFDLPVDVKRKVLRPDGVADYCGWLPLPSTPGLEAKEEVPEKTRPPDYKETYNFQQASPDSKFVSEEELPGFRAQMMKLINHLNLLLARILHALGLALQLEDPKVLLKYINGLGSQENETMLRLAFYPHIDLKEIKERQARCGEHTDFGLLTALFQNGVEGLQVFTRDKRFVDVQPVDGAILLNIGDTLERLTGGRLVSAKHRVVLDAKTAARNRYSVVYFCCSDFGADVEPYCGDRERYGERITAGAFIKRRFEDIFLRGEGVGQNTSS